MSTAAGTIDILYITYNRPDYTRLTLPRLLETCDESVRVWLWHNGEHAETLEVVRSLANHPRVHHFEHSVQNKRLREPTNWFWANAKGDYLSKIDDDNIMTPGWAQRLRAAHEAEAKLGVLGCWSFLEQDVVPAEAERKVRSFGGHRIMLNCWIAGTGYLMKRRCAEELGPIQEGQSFPQYCIQLALRGWIHGWPYPFTYMENLDDPRHPLTRLKTDEDFRIGVGLSAGEFGVRNLEDLRKLQPRIALEVQRANPDPRCYVGWRGRLRQVAKKVRRFRRRTSKAIS